MRKVWNEKAWDEYVYWQSQDKKTLRKINKLITEIERAKGKPIGHAEMLKGDLAGYSSNKIDDKNRLVYRVCGKGDAQYIEIIQCKTHYSQS